ncbi:proton-coupled folate transporter-like isoform X2 [Diorhabda sublineata]|uniref:proton-coupled folate transporter-like isoform X2 n=1 Tax=Diorhabda sublineata TaxID=1163346 RepID=UPI0024E0A2E9|nr:proton-coupled folate transporter-like isoform X2 [Diorhabda sublineata]
MAWNRYLGVEVMLLLCRFSMILEGSVYTNLYIYRTCYVILGYNQSDCAQLGNEVNDITKDLEPKVQPTVNKINMVQTVAGTLFPMIFNLFVGTWSDKFGRKPFLLLCLIGIIVTTTGNIFIIHFENASPWWFIVTSLPTVVTGGFVTLFIVISAYLVDSSTSTNRATRFSLIEVTSGIASFVGSLVSAPILYATSYQTIFIIAAGLQLTSFLYTLLFISETVKKENNNRVPKIVELIKTGGIIGNIKHALRKRENNIRPYLLMIVGVPLISGFASGQASVMNLFLRAKHHWNLTKINTVHSFVSVLNISGTLAGTFLLYKTLKMKEMHLILLCMTTASIGNLLWGLATNDYYIYATYIINCFGGLASLMWKTLLSYMVPPDEIGKILALVTIINNLNNLLSSLVYTNIYNATIDTNSGIFNFVSFGIHVVVLIIILFMLRLKLPRYQAPTDANAEIESGPKEVTSNNNTTESVKKNSNRRSLSLDIAVTVNNEIEENTKKFSLNY